MEEAYRKLTKPIYRKGDRVQLTVEITQVFLEDRYIPPFQVIVVDGSPTEFRLEAADLDAGVRISSPLAVGDRVRHPLEVINPQSGQIVAIDGAYAWVAYPGYHTTQMLADLERVES